MIFFLGLPPATSLDMARRLLVLLACALCALQGAVAMGGGDGGPPPDDAAGGGPPPAEEPKDPNCKSIIDKNTDTREFCVHLLTFTSHGFYEESDIVPEKGKFNGHFVAAGDLTADISVNCTLFYKSGEHFTPIANVVSSLQGLLDLNPNVVMNLNCFFKPKLELPILKKDIENGVEINGCRIYPRILVNGSPPGKYYVLVNQTSEAVSEELWGYFRVDFELKKKAEDEEC